VLSGCLSKTGADVAPLTGVSVALVLSSPLLARCLARALQTSAASRATSHRPGKRARCADAIDLLAKQGGAPGALNICLTDVATISRCSIRDRVAVDVLGTLAVRRCGALQRALCV
jgi:hypothetical protein